MLTTAPIRFPVAPVHDAVADALRQLAHLCQHGMHVGHHVLAVDHELGAGGHPQRDVQHGAVLGRVDVLAGEHRVPMLFHPRGAGQRHEEAHGLVRDPLLGVVQREVGALRREARRPFGVLCEEVAEMPRRNLVEVRHQGLPFGCRGHVHVGKSTGRPHRVRRRRGTR